MIPELSSGGGPCRELQRAIQTGLLTEADTEEFCDRVSEGINYLLADKRRAFLTKFSKLPPEAEFRFSIEDGKCRITVGGKDVSYNFQAYGEQIVLHLASLAAIKGIASSLAGLPVMSEEDVGSLEQSVAGRSLALHRSISAK